MSETLKAIAVLVCMAGAAFYAGVETGVIAINRMRLKHFVRNNVPGAAILQGFRENPDRLLGTTLVGTNICLVVISVLSAGLAAQWLGAGGEAVSSVVMTLVLLVFCEYLPKAWFYSRPWDRTHRFAGLLKLSETLLRPIGMVVVWMTRLILPGPSRTFSKPMPFVTRDDLKLLAREGEQYGTLSERERSMIHRVFDLPGQIARDIMIPRERMTFVHSDDTLETFFEVARSTHVSRMPVYDRARREFIGIVNVFYVLATRPQDRAQAVAPFARPPIFISESLPVDDIFPHLRRARQPMGLVVNAAREVVGLLTTEDILEAIVGKL